MIADHSEKERMKLQNNEKRMEIRIDSYEFPYDENSIYEDNNWLNVALEWEDEVVIENAISPCLTCMELQELCSGLSGALLGQPYISSFIEPDLTVRVKPHGERITVEITYAKPGHNRFAIQSDITKAQLDEMVSDVHEMCCRFPIRKKKLWN